MIQVTRNGDISTIKMARSIFRRPLYFTACYFVDGLLVDTGCASCSREFRRVIKQFDIKAIVNTHSHEDHIGNNYTFDIPIFCHRQAIPILADPRLLNLTFYQKLVWGIPPTSQATDIGEKLETENHHFKIIHTPGHSKDHICVYEPQEEWLFCGDAYVGGRDRVLREGFDILGIMGSLKKLNTLKIRRMFSGSGSVYENGNERLAEKILYLDDLKKRINELHDEGKAEEEIAKTLFGRESWIYYLTGGKFSSRNLVTSMLGGSPTQSSLKPLRV